MYWLLTLTTGQADLKLGLGCSIYVPELSKKANKNNFGDAGYRSPYLSHAKRALYHLVWYGMVWYGMVWYHTIPKSNSEPTLLSRTFKSRCLKCSRNFISTNLISVWYGTIPYHTIPNHTEIKFWAHFAFSNFQK